jgi:adenylyltransferase/sulfurtransferase
MDNDQLLRYSRQMMLPEIDAAGQLRLSEARVLIIGVGGLGSPVSLYLASSGVGHLVIVDHDKVDLSNLQRQIVHMTDDINRKKVESAKDHLAALNPDINVTAIDHQLDDNSLLEQVEQATVVVDATDNFASRFKINAACVKQKTPLVSAAAIRFEAQISTFDPTLAESPCYRCLYDEESNIDETCTANGVIAPLLGVVGSIQAIEAMKIIMGIGETLVGKLLLLDLLRMDFQQAILKKNPQCPVCQSSNSSIQ